MCESACHDLAASLCLLRVVFCSCIFVYILLLPVSKSGVEVCGSVVLRRRCRGDRPAVAGLALPQARPNHVTRRL